MRARARARSYRNRQRRTRLAKRIANASDGCREIALDEPSRQPQHANTERSRKLRIARDIERFESVMHGAIDFDDEPIRRTVEVDNEPDGKRMLTTEARPELAIANSGPEESFAARRMLAMKASELSERKERRGIVR